PIFGDVMKGTVLFSADSKTLFYAAGTPHKRDYAVYRNGKPGTAFNFIPGYSLKVSPDGQHVIFKAFNGKEEGPFLGDDPSPRGMNQMWYVGFPSLVKDDQILDNASGRYWISPDWKHMVWGRIDSTQKLPMGGFAESLIDDGKEVAKLPASAEVIALEFSANGRRWAALVNSRLASEVQIIADGRAFVLPPFVRAETITCPDSGPLKLQARDGRGVVRIYQFDPTHGRPAAN
ncbi:MAG: hypothetical protein JWM57_2046, partial [Phycisphaerales bacterium]|nr:hypothetical protein [Phycisphaerales bacterium]